MCRSLVFSRSLIVFSVLFIFVLPDSSAQDKPEFPKPEKEHAWLKKFVGEWTTTSKGTEGPEQQEVNASGRISSRMVGELWVVNEMHMEVQGQRMLGLQTIGYDPVRKKYVGTWVDSYINHMWQYEGTVNAAGTKLMLDARGPAFLNNGKAALYRDSYEFKSDDHIIVTSAMQDEDGKWVVFMKGESRRVKPAAR